MRKFIILVLLFICDIALSQNTTYTSSEIRSAKISAIELINEYKSILNGKTSHYSELYSIFSDSSSQVVCDILPENNLNNQMDLYTYIKKVNRNHRQQKITIHITDIDLNLSKQDFQLVVAVDKSIQASTRDGIEYLDKINNLLFHLRISKKMNFDGELTYESKIDSITSLDIINIDYKIAYIVEKDTTYDLADNNLIINNNNSKPVFYKSDWIGDGNKYFFIKNSKKNQKSRQKYSLDKAPFSFGLSPVDKSNYKNYRAFRKIKNLFLLKIKRPKYYFSINSNYSKIKLIDSNIYGIFNDKSQNQVVENGIEFGYYFSYKPKPTYHYLSLSLGLSNMNLSSTYLLSDYSYSYADVDPSGNDYQRRIKINNLSEEHIVSYLNLPLSISYGRNLKDSYQKYGFEKYSVLLPDFISFKLSSTYHMLQDATYNSIANVSYSGYYQDVFDVEIDDNGVYDFGDFETADNGELSFIDYYSTSLSIGFHKKLSKNKDRLFLDLEYSLNLNLTEPFEPENILITRTYDQLNSVINLIDSVSFTRNFLKFGFSYNF